MDPRNLSDSCIVILAIISRGSALNKASLLGRKAGLKNEVPLGISVFCSMLTFEKGPNTQYLKQMIDSTSLKDY
jgi:hypothetical protein